MITMYNSDVDSLSVIESLLIARERNALNGLSINELREEGRR